MATQNHAELKIPGSIPIASLITLYRTAMIASLAFATADASTIDLEETRLAIVTLQSVAIAPAEHPGTPSAPPEVFSGALVNACGKPLILTVLDPTKLETHAWRMVPHASQPQPINLIAWDPMNGLAILDLPKNAKRLLSRLNRRYSTLSLNTAKPRWGMPILLASQWHAGHPVISLGCEVSTPEGIEIWNGAEVFETDSSVVPLSRGGAVLDQQGRMLGIVHTVGGLGEDRVFTKVIAAMGIRRLVRFVTDGGQGALPKPRLGVGLANGLRRGAMVTRVLEGSAANKAGLQNHDLIIQIDQHSISSFMDAFAAVNERYPGDTLEVTVRYENETRTLPVTLEEAHVPRTDPRDRNVVY